MTNSTTIPIIYSGGAYGTFVEWCLNYFGGLIGDDLPFNGNGNSHKFSGNFLLNIDSWRAYLKTNQNHKLVRLHPKISTDESVLLTVNEIADTANRVVLLYADADSTLLNINNKFEKTSSDGWLARFEPLYVNSLSQWGKSNLSDMDIWELREFLSLYIFHQHESETELSAIKQTNWPNVLKIDIRNLFTDFKNTISEISNFCSIPILRNDFNRIYDHWLPLQQHTNKDAIVAKIVAAIVNNVEYDWTSEQLTIIDEAAVQMALRDSHKLDLLCYNLNVFPSNTIELRKYLTNAKSI